MTAHLRKTYLINPRFQIKFALYMCVLFLIASCFYPLVIYNLIEQLSSGTEKLALDFEHQKKTLIFVLATWQLGFTGLIFILCIFFGHKIAGPIYKITNALENFRHTKALSKISLREGDHFPELAEEVNRTLLFINEKYRQDFTYLSETCAHLNNLRMNLPPEKQNMIDELQNKLTEIQNRFNMI